jgi:hypothetical protein
MRQYDIRFSGTQILKYSIVSSLVFYYYYNITLISVFSLFSSSFLVLNFYSLVTWTEACRLLAFSEARVFMNSLLKDKLGRK